jgi:uncharacterized damage-inducible protein DinB
MPTSQIDELIATFRAQKRLAERAIEQLTDDQLRMALDGNTNSVAVVIKHMSGNMISRWTDLLTSDGEKPDRDRDGEFVDTFRSRAEIMHCWEVGWQRVFDTLASLSDEDLTKAVTIRGERSTARWAILRQVSHYGYHVGQIVLTARVLAKDRWQVITIPKGGSRQFNEDMSRKLGP